MKKESIGLMFSMMLLFAGYMFAENYYMKKQQTDLSNQHQNLTAARSITAPSSNQAKPNIVANSTEDKQLSSPANSQQSGNLPQSATTPAPSPETLRPLTVLNLEDLKLSIPYANLEFTQKGGCLGLNNLTTEHVAYNNKMPVSIIENYNICKAFGFKVGETDLRTEDAGFFKEKDGSLLIVQRTQNIEVTRIFHFLNTNYRAEMQVEIRNISKDNQHTSVDFELGATSDNKHAGGLFSMTTPQYHGAGIRLADGTVKRDYTPFDSSPDRKILLNETGVTPSWITVDSLYWMNTIIPQTHTPVDFVLLRTGYNLLKNSSSEVDQTVYEAWLKQPINLAPGQSQTYSYKIYFGPKSETLLKQFDKEYLNETIDYGFFKIVARPLYYLLNFIHDLVKNWGVAIIVLTIIINIIFMPLQIKGYASAQKMQKIQPEIKKLQEQYKEDKATLHKETMAIMAKNGVNPLSGCLPLLPQIPVFFGLNSTLQHTFDLRQSPFFFWIHDLTQHDPYFVLPIIMAILMIGYQKMMPMPSMDPAQAKMMKFLPIMFSIFMVLYPSGLALYVITNTIVSMIRQTFLMNRFKK